MRRPIWIVAVLAVTALVTPASASAITTQIDFDDLAAGTTLTSSSGVTFIGSPTVFNPVHVGTQSEPHAIHTPGTCTGSNCPSGANVLEIRFDSPKSSVSWRVGLDDEANGEFGTHAELVGYNAAGTPVASQDVNIGSGGFFPITTLVRATSSGVDIVRAVLTTTGEPKRVNADQLIVVDDLQPVPAPPAVGFTSPARDAAFDRIDDIRASGDTDAAAGLRRFCLTVTPTAPDPASFPARCEDAHLVASGSFSNVRTGPFVTGENFITAWIEDNRFRRASSTRRIVVNANDLRVTNMEVTQAVQQMLPVPAPAESDVEHSADYNGLPLMQRKNTAVRVWTGARLDAAGTPVRGVQVHLLGFDSAGRALPGGAIVPLEGTRDLGTPLSFDNPIGAATWSNPQTSWTFRLPVAWTDGAGPITLRAVINGELVYPRVSECAGCDANNAFSLRNISFERPRTLHIHPFQVFYRNAEGREIKPRGGFSRDLHGVRQEFANTIAISPFNLTIHPYRGTLNAQGFANDASLTQSQKSSRVKDLLTQAVDIAGYPGFHTMALMKGVINGLNGGHWSWSSFTYRNYSVVNTDRPLTSVGHELYHAIGFSHAGRACAGAVEGGGADSWPPDDRGLLQGVGTDVRPLLTRQPLRIFPLGQTDAEGNPLENFDLMSYCADNGSEFNAWISARNWAAANGKISARPLAGHGIGASQAATGPTIAVNASVFPDGGRIARVQPGQSQLSVPEGDGSVRIVSRDAGGNVLTDLPVLTRAGHTDPGGGAPAQTNDHLAAVIPAANVASVELVRAGQLLDTRRRSPAAPKTSISSPKAGLRVRSAAQFVDVRFATTDADGDALESSLEYSADDGKTYRGVAVGLTAPSFRLPAGLLNRASRARLRLRVNDGWNETLAVSRRFRVDGPPPAVAIASPAPGASARADQVIDLEGSAFDDRSRVLSGKSLRWFDGRRSLGGGERVSVPGLSPGTHTLRLVARDSSGRTGQASLKIKIAAVTPGFIALNWPEALKSTARTVRLQIASSVGGTVEIGKQKFPVDRRTRSYRFRITPGKSTLTLRPVLRSGGRTAKAKLTIPRS
jgi:hypothetical protein